MTERRVLSFYLAARDHYRPVMFSPNEVFVSPDTDETVVDGAIRTLRPPRAKYPISDILNRLPADQHPDLVVVKVDASERNMPSGLGALSCPKVLILGDTHHLDQPIRRLLAYAASEPFDLILSDCDRQHLHFFKKAGFPRVHWLPHLTWRPDWRDPAPECREDLVFLGQTGGAHRWRRHVLDHVASAGLPLTTGRVPQHELADVYSRARLTLNCSLNGDLNLRIFEVLAAGGLLLTDRLSRQAGLWRLLDEGRHFLGWGDVDELIGKARHYLEHEEEGRAIRRAGRLWLEERFHPDLQRRRFFDLLDHGREDPLFALADEPRCRVATPPPGGSLRHRAAVYERVQEMHRGASRLRLFATDPAGALAADLGDLPRLTVHPAAEAPDFHGETPAIVARQQVELPLEHLLAVTADEADLDTPLAAFRGRWVLVEGGDAQPSLARWATLRDGLAGWGFSCEDAEMGLFTRVDPVVLARRLLDMGRVAEVAGLLEAMPPVLADAWACVDAVEPATRIGRVDLADAFLMRAVRLDRGQWPAMVLLGRRMLAQGDKAGAFLMFDGARRRHTLPDEDQTSLDVLRMLVDRGRLPMAPYLAAVEPERRAPRHRRVRLLLVTNLFPPEEMGGYGRKLWEFTASLLRRGHEVRVVTGDAAYLRRSDDPEECQLEGVVSRSLELFGEWRGGACVSLDGDEIIRRSLRNADIVALVVDEMRPDVVLAGNTDFVGLNFMHELFMRGVPVIHSIGLTKMPVPGPEMEVRPALYMQAPASDWVGGTLDADGVAVEGRRTLYPGVRTQHYYRAVPPDRDRLRIAFAGLVMTYKGAHVLMNALGLLHLKGLDFTCTIAGDGDQDAYRAELLEYRDRMGMKDKVSFIGYQDRSGLARLFDTHNVFVFPSLVEEAFGMSQVEAMAAGLVCLTTATGGGREIVRDGIDGLIVKPGDSGDLVMKLLGLIQDPERWRRLAEAGQARALEFAVENSVDRLEDMIHEILARNGRA